MGKSYIQKFTFSELPLHGAYVELTHVWQTISSQKEYPYGLLQLLGELLVANILLTTNLKLKGKIIAQIQNNPKFDLVVSECSDDLKVRATAKYEASIHSNNQVNYNDCISFGNLVINIDSNSDGNLYQSVVALSGCVLDEVLTKYMLQSEQLRTRFFIAYSKDRVVGFMLQQLPDQIGDYTDDIDRVFMLVDTLKYNELLSCEINVILGRLFNEDNIVLYDGSPIKFGCTCGIQRVTSMLRNLGYLEALSIIHDEGAITVTCDFCNTVYSFSEIDVQNMFNNLPVDIECVSPEIH